MKILNLLITHFVASLGYIYFSILCRGNIYNEQEIIKTIRENKRFIIAMNHESYLDWIIIWAIFRYRYKIRLVFLAKEKLFKHKLWGRIMNCANCVKVSDSGGKIIDEVGKQRLNEGIIGIFPKGKRSRTGYLQEFRSGVAVMSKKQNIPVLPISLNGFYEAWKSDSKYPKIKSLNIVVGRLLDFEKDESIEDNLQKIRDSIKTGKNVMLINQQLFSKAIFDMDSTLIKTDIASLLFYTKKKRSSNLQYYLWLLKVMPLIPTLKILDKFSRPITQIIVYQMYSNIKPKYLREDAEEYITNKIDDKLIKNTFAFYQSLRDSNCKIYLVSTNTNEFVNAFANHIGVEGYGIELDKLRTLSFRRKISYLSEFKSNCIDKITKDKFIGIGDSKYDKPIFDKSDYSVLVCDKNEKRKLSREINNYIHR